MSNPIESLASSALNDAIARAVEGSDYTSIENRKQTIVSHLGRSTQLDEKRSALWVWLAARTGQIEILETLSTCGIDLDVRNENGQSALERLFSHDNVPNSDALYKTVAMLVQHCPTLSQPPLTDNWRYALLLPSLQGQTVLVRALFDHVFPYLNTEQRKDVIEATTHYQTPLMKATLNNHPDVVSLLLNHGADPDCKDVSKMTPLLHAADSGFHDIVDLLLGGSSPKPKTANVNYRSPHGLTALHFAALNQRKVVIERLLEVPDINVDLRDNNDRNALLLATSEGRYDLVKLLQSRYGLSRTSMAKFQACELSEAHTIGFHRPENSMRTHARYRKDSVATTLEAFAGKPGSSDVIAELMQGRFGTPSDDTLFTWVHLTANNLAWIDAVLAQLCFKESQLKADGYDLLLKLLAEQNHSPRIHSRHIRPQSRIYYQEADQGQGNSTPQRNQLVWLAMPFLQWDSHANVKRQKQIIDEVSNPPQHSGPTSSTNGKDAIAIGAYLDATTNLHLRRTLDQYRHPSMATDERDEDQVVYRYHRRIHKGDFIETKLFVVDQLWLIVLDGMALTCCPQNMDELNNNPLDTFQGMWNDVQIGLSSDVHRVEDLIAIIVPRCVGLFDRHYGEHGRRDLKFFEQFEISIGLVTRRVDLIQRQFGRDLANVTRWMNDKTYRPPPSPPIWVRRHDELDGDISFRMSEDESEKQDLERTPSFVNRLIDISKETQLHFECLDIDDELVTLSRILETQKTVLRELKRQMPDEGKSTQATPQHPWFRASKSIGKSIWLLNQDLAAIARLRDEVAEVANVLKHLLDLKPRHASAIEARFARDQAEDTARQGEIILVFTIVTIIFLPLSFMAAFFAIPITQFSREPTDTFMSLDYVSKYVFGIGLGFSVLLIAIAFITGDIKRWTQAVKKGWLDQRRRRRAGNQPFYGTGWVVSARPKSPNWRPAPKPANWSADAEEKKEV